MNSKHVGLWIASLAAASSLTYGLTHTAIARERDNGHHSGPTRDEQPKSPANFTPIAPADRPGNFTPIAPADRPGNFTPIAPADRPGNFTPIAPPGGTTP